MSAVAQRGAGAEVVRPAIVVVLSAKGGVGKTMIVMALLAYAAYLGRRAIGADADPQASTYDLSGALHKPGYKVVHIRDVAELAGLRELVGFDLVVVDMPGNLDTREGKVLAEAVLEQADFVVIPYDHQPSTLMPTMRTVEFVEARKIPYRVLLTNIDGRLGPDVIEQAWNVLGSAPHFRTWLRKWSAWPNSQVAGRTIMRYSQGNAREARKDIAAVYSELMLDLGRVRAAGRRGLWRGSRRRAGRWLTCCGISNAPWRSTSRARMRARTSARRTLYEAGVAATRMLTSRLAFPLAKMPAERLASGHAATLASRLARVAAATQARPLARPLSQRPAMAAAAARA